MIIQLSYLGGFSVEFFSPNNTITQSQCSLSRLPTLSGSGSLYYHTMNGLTVCGGWERTGDNVNTSNACKTLGPRGCAGKPLTHSVKEGLSMCHGEQTMAYYGWVDSHRRLLRQQRWLDKTAASLGVHLGCYIIQGK